MIRVGIIGSGFGLYGLLPAFRSIQGCEVVAISGKKTDRLFAYCNELNLTNIFEDWKKMIDTEKLDAIAIAMPPRIQHEIGMVAIEKNIHIFAEKPLAANVQQAQELYEQAEKHNIITAVDFIFPEIEEWQAVKRMIDDEKYGTLQYISVDWDFFSYDIKNEIASWKTDVSEGGGALSFYFSHALYYLEYLVGNIVEVESKFVYSDNSLNGGEVGVDMVLTFDKGIVGDAHIHIDNNVTKRHRLQFVCKDATITLQNEHDVTDNFCITVDNGTDTKVVSVKSDVSLLYNEDERARIVQKIASRFIQGCENKKPIIPSFTNGLRVQYLIDKVRKSQII